MPAGVFPFFAVLKEASPANVWDSSLPPKSDEKEHADKHPENIFP